jgi:hypothetical protein
LRDGRHVNTLVKLWAGAFLIAPLMTLASIVLGAANEAEVAGGAGFLVSLALTYWRLGR